MCVSKLLCLRLCLHFTFFTAQVPFDEETKEADSCSLGCRDIWAMSFITSAGEGMRAHQRPGIDPCVGQPLFPAAPGSVSSVWSNRKEETQRARQEGGVSISRQHF